MTTTAETAMARRKTWFGLMQTSHAEETSHAQQGMRTVIFTLPEHIFDALWAESIATESSLGVLMAERLADSLRGDDLLCTCGVCGRPIKDGEPRAQDFEVGTVCVECSLESEAPAAPTAARAHAVAPSEAEWPTIGVVATSTIAVDHREWWDVLETLQARAEGKWRCKGCGLWFFVDDDFSTDGCPICPKCHDDDVDDEGDEYCRALLGRYGLVVEGL